MSGEENLKKENPERNGNKDFSKNPHHKGNEKGHNQGNKNNSNKDHKPRTFVADKQNPETKGNENQKGNGKKEKKPEYQSLVDKILKASQKDFDEQFLKFLEYVSQDSLDNLKSVIDYMAELYSKANEKEREKNRKKIDAILLNPNFISFISKLKNRSSEVFVILKKFDDNFDLQKYSGLTLNMETIFYGSYVKDGDDGYKVNPPLNSRSIYQLIEILLDNDKDLASKWILEVFNYDKSKLYNKKFEDIVNPDSEDFKKILKDNSKAHQIFIDLIFSKKPFQTVIETKNKFKEIESTLNRKISELEDGKRRLEYDALSKTDKIRELENEISSQNIKLDKLNTEKVNAENDCAKWKSQFETINSRFSSWMTQMTEEQKENEQFRIDAANKEKADEDFINALEDQKEKLEKELESLKADFALKSHKLSELSNAQASSGIEARSITMKNLVQKVSTPFYYLSMFCQEFNDTQTLSEESVPFFIDTINQLESAFALMGAKKFGKLDEIVKYDSSIHEPMGGNLANGDSAKITEPGWRIEDEVFIKAKVEKVEDK